MWGQRRYSPTSHLWCWRGQSCRSSIRLSRIKKLKWLMTAFFKIAVKFWLFFYESNGLKSWKLKAILNSAWPWSYDLIIVAAKLFLELSSHNKIINQKPYINSQLYFSQFVIAKGNMEKQAIKVLLLKCNRNNLKFQRFIFVISFFYILEWNVIINVR